MEFEAIYQFGDSLSDTGNYVREHASSAYSRLPYGQTYYPTGRASDGLIMVDYFGTFLELTTFLLLSFISNVFYVWWFREKHIFVKGFFFFDVSLFGL